MGAWFDKIAELEPLWFFPLDEAVGAVSFDGGGAYSGTRDGTTTGSLPSVTAGEPSLSPAETSTSVKMVADGPGRIIDISNPPEFPVGSGNTWQGNGRAFSFRFESLGATDPASDQKLIRDYSGSSSYYVQISAAGDLEFMHRIMTPSFSYANKVLSAGPVGSGDIVAQLDWRDAPDALVQRLYVNGVKVAEETWAGYPIVYDTGDGTVTHGMGGNCRMQGYAAFEKVLTNKQIADLHTLADGGTVEVPTGPPVDFWDGSARQPATLLGWWDGSAVQPATLQGHWDGSTVVPL